MICERKVKSGIALVLCVCLVLTGIYFSEPAYSADTTDPILGNMIHYNGFIFNNFSSYSADIEGALAVGGDAAYGTGWGQYDVGASAHHVVMGQYNNPNNYPTLLQQGKPNIGVSYTSWINIYGGPVVMPEAQRANYNASFNKFSATKGVQFLDDDRIKGFFESAYNTAAHTVRVLDDAYSDGRVSTATIKASDFIGWNGAYTKTFANLAQFVPDNLEMPGSWPSTKVLVINVSDSGNVNINGPNITSAMGDYDLIIFNFPNASGATFTGSSLLVNGAQVNTTAPVSQSAQNAILKNYAQKVIWNFPAAGTINVNGGGVVGSVIAPYAYLKGNGGSINGMLVADSFSTEGGMELHSFYMNRNIFELGGKEEEELVGSIEIYKYDAGATVGQNTLASIAMLERVEFTLFTKGGEQVGDPIRTDQYGYAKFENIPAGDYYLKETRPLPGYAAMADHAFTIDDTHGVASPLVFYFENAQKSIDVQLRKVAAPATGEPLIQEEPLDNEDAVDDRRKGSVNGHDEEEWFDEEEELPGEELLDQEGMKEAPAVDEGAPETIAQVMAAVGVRPVQLNHSPRTSAKTSPESDAGVESNSTSADAADTAQPFDESETTDDNAEAADESDNEEGQEPEEPKEDEVVDDSEDEDEDDSDSPEKDGGNTDGENSTNDQDQDDDSDLTDPPADEPLVMAAEGQLEGGGLAGAKFNLYRVFNHNRNNVAFIETIYSDHNGYLDIKDLTSGTYALQEVDAPEGYQLLGEGIYVVIEVLIDDDGGLYVKYYLHNDKENEDQPLPEDEDGVPLIYNEKEPENPLYTVVVTKLDKFDSTPLQGVSFEVTVQVAGDETKHYEKITDSFGQVQFVNVPAGVHKVTEFKVDGYSACLDDDCEDVDCEDPAHSQVSIVVGQNQDDHVLHYTFYNKPNGVIELKKVTDLADDGSDYVPLAGAEFALYYDDGNSLKEVDRMTSKADGLIRFTGLKPGTYYAKETAAPLGYNIVTEEWQWEIGGAKEGTDEKVYRYTFAKDEGEVDRGTLINNTAELYRALFRKVDEDNPNTVIPGVDFALYQLDRDSLSWKSYPSEESNQFTTNEYGELELDNLLAGRYLLQEEKAAPGYEPLDAMNNAVEIMFTVGVVGPRPDTNVYYITNKQVTPEANLKIVKTDDSESPVRLAGAEFALYVELEGKDIPADIFVEYKRGLITDENGEIFLEGLEVGNYKLMEVKAPTGYEIIEKYEEIRFRVVEKQTEPVSAEVVMEAPDELVVRTASENGELYYVITVVNEAPIEFPNIKLTKVDADDRSVTLQGAVFIMFKKVSTGSGANDFYWQYYTNLISDETGNMALPRVTKGEYMLSEVRTPEGYINRNAEFYFEVAEGSDGELVVIYNGQEIPRDVEANEDVELEIINYKEERVGGFTIIKVDGEDTEKTLTGAEFVLYRYDESGEPEYYLGELNGKAQFGISEPKYMPVDAAGLLTVKNLPFGTYYLEETKAPAYYDLSSTGVKEIIIDATSINETYKIGNNQEDDEGSGLVQIQKRDETGKPLTGAGFIISMFGFGRAIEYYAGDDGSGAKWTQNESEALELFVDDEGILQVANLPFGRYLLTETTTPEGYHGVSLSTVFSIQMNYDDKDPQTIEYVTVINEKLPTTSVTITKYGVDSAGVGLAGMSFIVKRELAENAGEITYDFYQDIQNEVVIWTEDKDSAKQFTTGKNGSINVSGLTAGNYIAEEIDPPTGYAVANEHVKFIIAEDAEDGGLKVEWETSEGVTGEGNSNLPITNKRNTADITIRKVSETSEDIALGGAEFILCSGDGATYYKNNGSNQLTQAHDEDDAKLSPFITKVDGTVEIKYVPMGDYQLIETKAPDGYELPEDTVFWFTVVEEADETTGIKVAYAGTAEKPGEKLTDGVIVIVDALIPAPTGDIYIQKVSSDLSGTVLDGAEFVIKRSSSKENYEYYKLAQDGSVTWVTELDDAETFVTQNGQTPLITGLEAGTYTLEEITPPAGYALPTQPNTVFTIYFDRDGKLVVDTTVTVSRDDSNGPPMLIVPNALQRGSIFIEKVSSESENTTLLNGAKFILKKPIDVDTALYYSLAGSNTVNWVANEADATVLLTDEHELLEIKGLIAGSYVLKEIEAPYEYELPDQQEISFNLEITSNGLISVSGETGGSWSLRENHLVVTIENDPVLVGEIVIKKISSDASVNTLLDGAKFILSNEQDEYYYLTEDDEVIWVSAKEQATVFVTEDGEPLVIAHLVRGAYTLEELEAPEGYQLPANTKIKFAISFDAEGETIITVGDVSVPVLEVVNSPVPTTAIRIKKSSSDASGKLLVGAKFMLKKVLADSVVYYSLGEDDKVEWVTEEDATTFETADELLEIKYLEAGTYRLVETKAPKGHLLPADPETEFTIRFDGDKAVITVDGTELPSEGEIPVLDVINTPIPTGSVQIKKTSSVSTATLLKGAEFKLKRVLEDQTVEYYALNGDGEVEWVEEDNADTFKTGSDGTLTIGKLEAGVYTLVETKAPRGYKLTDNREITFTLAIDANLNVTVTEVTGAEPADENGIPVLTVTNIPKPTTGVRLIKVSAKDATVKLPNAQFILQRIPGNVYQPTYYKLDDGEVSWVWSKDEATPLVTTAEGEVAISGLPEGAYMLEETKAPAGYQELVGTIDFTVTFDDDDNPTVKLNGSDASLIMDDNGFALLTVENKPEPQRIIQLNKISAETRLPLKGAEFILERDGAVEKYYLGEIAGVPQWTASSDEAHVFVSEEDKLLEIRNLDEGRYTLREIEAPDGYEDTDLAIPFTLSYDGDEFQISVEGGGEFYSQDDKILVTIANTPLTPPGKLKIRKESAEEGNHEGLAGAQFTLKRLFDGFYRYYHVNKETNQVSWVAGQANASELTTNEAGELTIVDLEAGVYVLEETKAPEGFEQPQEGDLGITIILSKSVNGNYLVATAAGAGLEKDGDDYFLLTVVNTPEVVKPMERIIQLNKVSAETQQPLTGAEFILKNAVGEYYSGELEATPQWTSDYSSAHVFISNENELLQIRNLPEGHYTLEEIKAPEGYVNAQLEFPFDLDYLEDEFKITVNGNELFSQDDKLVVTVANSPIPEPDPTGSLKIRKESSEEGDDRGLEGAEFILKRLVGNFFRYYRVENGEVSWVAGEGWATTLSTDEYGELEIVDLEAGIYVLEETKAPAGFEPPAEDDHGLTIILNVSNQGNYLVALVNGIPQELDEQGYLRLTVENTPEVIEPFERVIQLLKISAETQEPLSGVGFKLKKFDLDEYYAGEDEGGNLLWVDAEESAWELVTDEAGLLEIRNLPAGSYTLIESTIPEGYGALELAVSFELADYGDDGEFTIHVYGSDFHSQEGKLLVTLANTPQTPDPDPELKGNLKIRKVSEEDENALLGGAEFILKRLSNGMIRYYHQALDGTVDWIVMESQATRLRTGDYGELEIADLEAGIYVLQEVEAPTGYEQPSADGPGITIILSMSEDGTRLVAKVNGEERELDGNEDLWVTVTNKPLDWIIQLNKISAETQRPLADAQFILKNSIGEYYAIDEESNLSYWTSEFELAHIFVSQAAELLEIRNLEAGNYILEEIAAPTNYEKLADNIHFELIYLPEAGEFKITVTSAQYAQAGELYSQDGKLLVTIANTPKPPVGNLKIKKVSSTDGMELAGAEFILKKLEGYFYRYYQFDNGAVSWVAGAEHATPLSTDDLGELEIANLETGIYVLEETKAPDGYARPADDELGITVSLTVSDDGSHVVAMVGGVVHEPDEFGYLVVKVENDPKPDPERIIQLNKVAAETQEPLADAHFILTDAGDPPRYYKVENDGSVIWTDVSDEATEFITDGQELLEIRNLLPGNYTLIESKAPEGYDGTGREMTFELIYLDDEFMIIVNGVELHSENVRLVVTVANSLIPEPDPTGGLKIRKESSVEGNDEGLQGATFILQKLVGNLFRYYHVENGVVSWVVGPSQATPLGTDENGEILIDNLEAGIYVLQETQAPNGYKQPAADDLGITILMTISEDRKSIVTTVDGVELDTVDNSIALLRVENTPAPQRLIQLRKISAVTQQPLAGAVFVLQKAGVEEYYQGETNYVPQWTSNSEEAHLFESNVDELLEIRNLPEGNYILNEIETPEGYEPGLAITFTLTYDGDEFMITVDGRVMKSENDRLLVTIANTPELPTILDPTGNLKIRKVSSEPGNDDGLVGAEFRLKKLVGGLFRYYNKEEGAEAAWVVGPALASTLETNDLGELLIEDLEAGIYVLEETKAPAGFEQPAANDPGITIIMQLSEYGDRVVASVGDSDLTMDNDGYLQLTVENTPISRILQLNKVSSETQLPLAGAQFILINADNSGYYTTKDGDPAWTSEREEADIFESNGIDMLEIRDLAAGNYTLVEIKAPDGYDGAGMAIHFKLTYTDEEEFAISVNGSTEELHSQGGKLIVTIANTPKPPTGNLKVRKVSEENEETLLEGAEFVLKKLIGGLFRYYRVDGDEVEWVVGPAQATPLYTDENGVLQVENLAAGIYVLQETKAPSGYEQPKDDDLGITIILDVSADGTYMVATVDGTEQKPDDEGYLWLTVTNKPKPAPERIIKLKKISAETQEPLEGVKFILRTGDGSFYYALRDDGTVRWTNNRDQAEPFISGPDGIVSISNLPEGGYTLIETETAGYGDADLEIDFELAYGIDEFTLTVDGSFFYSKDDVLELTLTNTTEPSTPGPGPDPDPDLKGNLWIRKISTDAETESGLLGGAEFVLKKLSNGLIKYYKNDDGIVTWVLLADQATRLITEFDRELVIKDLDPGIYVLQEVQAPQGYEQPATDDPGITIILSISEDGKDLVANVNKVGWELNDNNLTLTVKNSPKVVERIIQLKKVSAEDQQPLADAKFILMNADREEYYTIKENGDVEWVSDQEEAHQFVSETKELLEIRNLEPGSYTLIEIEAPDNYANENLEITFALEYVGDEFTIKVNNSELISEGGKLLVTVANTLEVIDPTGSLKIRKVSSDDDSNLLEGAEFILKKLVGSLYRYYHVEGENVSWVVGPEHATPLYTDANGELKIEDLEAGVYVLQEIQAPSGYESPTVDDSGITIILTALKGENKLVAKVNGAEQQLEDDGYLLLVVENKPKQATDRVILLNKVAAEDQRPLGGAKFYLINRETGEFYTTSGGTPGWTSDPEKAEVFESSEADMLEIRNLPPGEYTLHEFEAPIGYDGKDRKIEFELLYDKDDDEFTIKVSGAGTLNSENNQLIVTIANALEPEGPGPGPAPEPDDLLANLKIRKESSEEGNDDGLKGAEFILKRVSTGMITYYSLNERDEVVWVLMKDWADTLTTDSDGLIVIEDLEPGIYVLQETKAPDGYLPPADDHGITVIISASGKYLVANTADGERLKVDEKGAFLLTVENMPEKPVTLDPATIQIRKVSKEEPETALAGAEFILKRQVGEDQYEYYTLAEDGYIWGNTKDEAYKWVTYESGMTGAFTLDAGTYILVETKAPVGYIPANTDIIFTVVVEGGKTLVKTASGTDVPTEDGTFVLKVTNAKDGSIPGTDTDPELFIRKVSSESSEIVLEGALFILQRVNADDETEYCIWDDEDNLSWTNSDEQATVFETDKNGLIKLTELPDDTYTLVEIQAPEGYLNDNSPLAFTLTRVDDEMIVTVDGEEIPADEKGIIEITIKNTPGDAPSPDQERNFRIKKITSSSSGTTLAGAEFVLRQTVEVEIDGEMVEIYQYFTVDAEGMAVWRDNLAEAYTFVTDHNGLITFKDLPEGTYTLVETKAPSGYQLPTNRETTFELTYEGEHAVIKVGEDRLADDEEIGVPVIFIKNDPTRSRKRRPNPDPGTEEPGDPDDPDELEDPDLPEDPNPADQGDGGDDWQRDDEDDTPGSGGGDSSDELDDTPKTGSLAMALPFLFFNLLACGYLMIYLRNSRKARYRGRHYR